MVAVGRDSAGFEDIDEFWETEGTAKFNVDDAVCTLSVSDLVNED